MTDKLIERLEALLALAEPTDDAERDHNAPDAECVFVDMRPAEFEALIREAAAAIRVLLKEIDALRHALETMVEMVEMNGFGRAYAMDVARAAIAKAPANDNNQQAEETA